MSSKGLASPTEGPYRIVPLGGRLETTAVCSGSGGSELPPTASLAADDRLMVRRGLVYLPTMTHYGAKEGIRAHRLVLTGAG